MLEIMLKTQLLFYPSTLQGSGLYFLALSWANFGTTQNTSKQGAVKQQL